MHDKFDVIITGAGPAGAACALSLKHSGLRVLLLDKASFPRDKICGDALSVDVLNQLPLLSENLPQEFAQLPLRTASAGVRIFSPGMKDVDIPFIHKGEKRHGYICPRTSFDDLLFQEVKKCSNIIVKENCAVEGIEIFSSNVKVKTPLGDFESQMVVGADGAHSVTRKLLRHHAIERNHHSAGLRQYYEGVTSFHEEGFIELYFFKDILPGYLWIFPLPDDKANVGIGMLSSEVARRKVNLREVMERLIVSHPAIRERFTNARPLETPKGYGLPLGSRKRSISGTRYLLTGDAAGLIDPFSGEGIANAIRSGRIAAGHIINCFDKNCFSAAFNTAYDKEIYRRMWKELRLSYMLQRLCRYPWLFDQVVQKASKVPYWHQFLIDALANPGQKWNFVNPLFYYKLFFR